MSRQRPDADASRQELDDTLTNPTAGKSPEDDTSPARERIEWLFDLLKDPGSPKNQQGLVPGTRLGDFEILRQLGAGGMGEVYLAHQQSLDRRVAIKVCKSEFSRDARLRSRFESEGRALAQLKHKNVVPVLLTGETDDHLYLAMEYVPGPSLHHVLQAIRCSDAGRSAEAIVQDLLHGDEHSLALDSLTDDHAQLDRRYTAWAADMLEKVAQGLGAIHDAGIIHRDLKPANIIIGSDGEPRIVDFGLARDAAASHATVTGEFFGTPAYCSPEQAAAEHSTVTSATDVFSFGVILFECFSLRRPFEGSSSIELLHNVREGKAALLRQSNPSVPWELEAIADKCLQKLPIDRYQDGDQLAGDLRNYLSLRPIQAKKMTMARGACRAIQRRPMVTVLGAAVCLLLVLSFLVGREWIQDVASQRRQAAEVELRQTIDAADRSAFRYLTASLPTWLPDRVEQIRGMAYDAYTSSLDSRPEDVWLYVQRARLDVPPAARAQVNDEQRLERALADLRRAKTLAPESPAIYLFESEALRRLGRDDEADEAVAKAKTLYPRTANDLYWMANYSGAYHEDFVAAHDSYTKCLSLEADHYWARIERVIHGYRIDPATASDSETDTDTEIKLEELRMAKNLRPDLPFASEFLALYQKYDDREAAIRELREYHDKFGMTLLTAHDLSDLLSMDGNLDDAEETLRSVMAMDSGGMTAHQLAVVLAKKGQFQSAVEWFKQAVSQGAHNDVVIEDYVKTLQTLGKSSDVEEVYREAIAAHPDHVRLVVKYGLWLESQSRNDDAIEQLHTALQMPLGTPQRGGVVDNTYTFAVGCNHLAQLLWKAEKNEAGMEALRTGMDRLRKIYQAPPAWLRTTGRPQVRTATLVLAAELIDRLLELQRRDEAIVVARTMTELRPFDADGVAVLASAFRRLEMPNAAFSVARGAEFAKSLRRGYRGQTAIDEQLLARENWDEYGERLAVRHAMGLNLSEVEYLILAERESQSTAILCDATRLHPVSFILKAALAVALSGDGDTANANMAIAEAWTLLENSRSPTAESEPSEDSRTVSVPDFARVLEYAFRHAYRATHEFAADEEIQRARRLWATVVRHDSQSVDPLAIHVALARALLREKAWDAAADQLEELVASQDAPLANWATQELTSCLDRLDRPQAAVAMYQQAVRNGSREPHLVLRYLSLCLRTNGVGGIARGLIDCHPKEVRIPQRTSAITHAFAAWAFATAGQSTNALESVLRADAVHTYAMSDLREALRETSFQTPSTREEFESNLTEECITVSLLLEQAFQRLERPDRSKYYRDLLSSFAPEKVGSIERQLQLSSFR